MNTIRRIERQTDNFTIIQNSLINEFSLSFKARGILFYILSKPKDWVVYVSDLSQGDKDKEKSVRAGINELIEARYMQRIKVYDYDTKRILRWETLVSEIPFEKGDLIDRVIEKYHRDEEGNIINIKQSIRGKMIEAPLLLERKELLVKDKVKIATPVENSTFELDSENVEVASVEIGKDALQINTNTKDLSKQINISSSREDEEEVLAYAESLDLKVTKKVIRGLLKLHTKENILRAIELSADREIKSVKAYLVSVLKDIENPSVKNINVTVESKENKLKFDNFKGRDYDYNELERKLLGWD